MEYFAYLGIFLVVVAIIVVMNGLRATSKIAKKNNLPKSVITEMYDSYAEKKNMFGEKFTMEEFEAEVTAAVNGESQELGMMTVLTLCGGTLRVIADVTDPDAIQTILAHLKQRAPPDAVHRQRPGQGPQNDLFAAI